LLLQNQARYWVLNQRSWGRLNTGQTFISEGEAAGIGEMSLPELGQTYISEERPLELVSIYTAWKRPQLGFHYTDGYTSEYTGMYFKIDASILLKKQ
jgi:hypothetical protein